MHNWLVNKMCLFRCVRQMRVSSDSIDLCGAIRFASDAPPTKSLEDRLYKPHGYWLAGHTSIKASQPSYSSLI